MSQMIEKHAENKYAECEIRKVSEAEYAELIEHFILEKERLNQGESNVDIFGGSRQLERLERKRQ